MKWIVTLLLVLGLALVGWGTVEFNRSQVADQKMGGAILGLIGGVLLVLDLIIVLIWGLIALFTG